MLYEYEKIEDHVTALKNMAAVTRGIEDSDVNFFRQREIVVDGYAMIVFYNRAYRDDIYVDVVLIVGKYMPFLPLASTFKVVSHFLGKKELLLSEAVKRGMKVY